MDNAWIWGGGGGGRGGGGWGWGSGWRGRGCFHPRLISHTTGTHRRAPAHQRQHAAITSTMRIYNVRHCQHVYGRSLAHSPAGYIHQCLLQLPPPLLLLPLLLLLQRAEYAPTLWHGVSSCTHTHISTVTLYISRQSCCTYLGVMLYISRSHVVHF